MASPHSRQSHLGSPHGRLPPTEFRRFGCPYGDCLWSFNDLPHLRRHLNTVHVSQQQRDNLELCCPVEGCPFWTLYKTNLNIHLNGHTGDRPYKCPVEGCNFDTKDPAARRKHFLRMHGESHCNTIVNHPRSKSPDCAVTTPNDHSLQFVHYAPLAQANSPASPPIVYYEPGPEFEDDFARMARAMGYFPPKSIEPDHGVVPPTHCPAAGHSNLALPVEPQSVSVGLGSLAEQLSQ
ncbi:hypothetical protein MIND_00806800 [Mycena indigotica]|uniref:C2H2-type domain-containing protein n=1 Tax=Mycena indigotica TaxID=2126181 RepID=A0A8H6SGM8_9AGAR|nr:uncharacterized protein MIND_00806800 [Mycena indigotica]KAF7298598.1 hypothetical protein MIND_00806800 [Mycena indigotica]